MRKLSVLLIICLGFVTGNFGQNLVMNPSFEDTVTCPNNTGSVDFAVGWSNAGDSPDYYHPCATAPDFSVPNNWGGYQQPASGIAYVGLGTWGDYQTNIREFISSQLISSLTSGQKYFVSMKINLSLYSPTFLNSASNNMGALFTMNSHSISNPPPINNNPHFHTDNLIIDTANWVRISGSFIADSNYNYINIGNFYNDANTTIQIFQQDTFQSAYYFIDDVCVSIDSLTCNPLAEVKKNEKDDDSFISPNPANEKIIIDIDSYSNTDIEIVDLNGKILLKSYVNSDIEIDCSTWNSGLYFVKLTNKSISKSQKLNINH